MAGVWANIWVGWERIFFGFVTRFFSVGLLSFVAPLIIAQLFAKALSLQLIFLFRHKIVFKMFFAMGIPWIAEAVAYGIGHVRVDNIDDLR